MEALGFFVPMITSILSSVRSTAEPITSMSKSGCSDCDACYYPDGNSCLRGLSQEDCNYYSDTYGTKWCVNYDRHLASALLSALPSCIMQDYYMWRGPKPSIPYQDMRRLLEQHWPDFTLKYPSILGPPPTALAVPVHGSAPATATTRSSALALPAFRDGMSQRDGYGQAAAAPWGTQGHTSWRIDVATACPQSAAQRTPVRIFPGRSTRTRCVKTLCSHHDGLPYHLANYPQVVAVDELKADPAATAVANATAKATGAIEEPGYPSSTPFAKATHPAAYPVMQEAVHQVTLPAVVQATPAWDKAAIPATPVSITVIIATINAAAARFVSRPPAIAVTPAIGTATTAKTAGTIATTADLIVPTAAPTKMTGTTVAAYSMYDDWRHRSRSRSAPPVDQGYVQQASTPQRSQSRSASRGSTRTL
ncbi:hypothetical protein DYB26_014248, partial [Aphanomyces astaci]